MMKRLLSMLLVLALLPLFAASAESSGSCGAKLTWVCADGVLTVTGKGPMDDFGSVQEQPWNQLAGQISRVVIGNGVTTVGGNAFAGCRGLTSVSFPSSMRIIGSQAFSMTALKELSLPKNLNQIGRLAFQNISITELTLPAGLKTLETNAFNNCKQLVRVEIGAKLTAMHPNPFSGCEALREITIAEGNPAYRVVDGCILDQRNSLLVFSPYGEREAVIPEGTVIIGGDCFAFNRTLERVTVPEGVWRIESSAFRVCANLAEVVLPDSLTELQDCAFQHDTSLKELNLPAGLRQLGREVFTYSALTRLTVPEGVTLIGDSAFFACADLMEIHLPASVTLIEPGAFDRCSEKLTIWAPKGSYALQFAREHKIRYRAEKNPSGEE